METKPSLSQLPRRNKAYSNGSCHADPTDMWVHSSTPAEWAPCSKAEKLAAAAAAAAAAVGGVTPPAGET
ncbi:hypothetical protein ABZP36_019264, partial [Zizania latifolia]